MDIKKITKEIYKLEKRKEAINNKRVLNFFEKIKFERYFKFVENNSHQVYYLKADNVGIESTQNTYIKFSKVHKYVLDRDCSGIGFIRTSQILYNWELDNLSVITKEEFDKVAADFAKGFISKDVFGKESGIPCVDYEDYDDDLE
jgi:RAB protein geranylgeranyltransferase component A